MFERMNVAKRGNVNVTSITQAHEGKLPFIFCVSEAKRLGGRVAGDVQTGNGTLEFSEFCGDGRKVNSARHV